MRMAPVPPILAIALLTIACERSADEADNAARDTTEMAAVSVQTLFRGIASTGEGGLTFVPCGTTDTVALADSAHVLQNVTANRSAEPHFVIVAGRRGTELAVEEVLYATTETFECHSDWSSFEYRAAGNNPGWLIEVMGPRVQLRREGGQTTEFSLAQNDSVQGRIRILADDTSQRRLELHLQQQACRNPVTGAYSAWSARARLGPETLNGCAMIGRQ